MKMLLLTGYDHREVAVMVNDIIFIKDEAAGTRVEFIRDGKQFQIYVKESPKHIVMEANDD